jgi:hypothetical protein
VQRVVVVVADRERELCVAVAGERDVGHGSDRHARHLQQVAGDDLAGVGEHRLDRVGAGAREHDHRDRHHGDEDRADGGDPADHRRVAHARDLPIDLLSEPATEEGRKGRLNRSRR